MKTIAAACIAAIAAGFIATTIAAAGTILVAAPAAAEPWQHPTLIREPRTSHKQPDMGPRLKVRTVREVRKVGDPA